MADWLLPVMQALPEASDIQGLDEGSQSPFIRDFFNCQELPTDEAIVSWNDQTIHDFHDLKMDKL